MSQLKKVKDLLKKVRYEEFEEFNRINRKDVVDKLNKEFNTKNIALKDLQKKFPEVTGTSLENHHKKGTVGRFLNLKRHPYVEERYMAESEAANAKKVSLTMAKSDYDELMAALK